MLFNSKFPFVTKLVQSIGVLDWPVGDSVGAGVGSAVVGADVGDCVVGIRVVGDRVGGRVGAAVGAAQMLTSSTKTVKSEVPSRGVVFRI
jgi:hypothetical protein